MDCFGLVWVDLGWFGLVWVGLGWFGLAWIGPGSGGGGGTYTKDAGYTYEQSKGKSASKRRPFSGHKMRTKSMKADYRPSYLWSHFCDRQVGAFLGSRLVA